MKIPKYGLNLLNNMWNACTNEVVQALSEMMEREVKIKCTSLKITILNDLPKIINSREPSTTLVYMKLKDSVKGIVLISSSLKNMLNLIEIIMHKKIGYYEALSDENIPVICELGYILSGYYISSLVKLFGEAISWEKPILSTNPVRAIEDFDLGPVYKEKIYVLMFRAVLHILPKPIELQVVLLFRKEDVDKILETISEKATFKLN